MSSSQLLPPGMAHQFAKRARNGEGVAVGTIAVEFPQHGSVVCVMYPDSDNPMGHITKNPRRADELREILKARSNA